MNKLEFVDLEAIAEVAHGLQELREKVVFVGGAVLGLYADAPATPEFRPTRDIDLTIELVSLSNWARLQERLSELGFMPDASGQVICRYLFHRIAVDIMPAEESPFGPTNPWFKPGLPHVFLQKIAPELEIRLLPVAYILATKFAAFQGRGNDHRTSHDFEDIVFLSNNRVHIVAEILNSNSDVREFLREEALKIWKHPGRNEFLAAHLPFFEAELRLPLILEKIQRIAGLV